MREQAQQGLPAAIYARISKDRAGAKLGVDRQEAECRELADRLGWKVVAVYVDNDISAYSGKVRPQYRQMIEDVKAGKVRGLLAWHADRLHRRATELESFVTLVEDHHVQVETVSAGKVDLSTPSGRLVARQLGSVAQYEVEQTRDRIRAQKLQAAEQGKYRGGPRPYGYNKGGMKIRASEAEVIREATTSILAGRTLAGVARELNERGEVTSTGKPWNYMRLRDVLIRPRNAGLLSKGRFDRGTGDIVGKAKWPAVVDEETWRAVHTLLIDPSRRKQNGNAVRWLGSGIYSCAKCGGSMRCTAIGGVDSKRGGSRRYYYRCVEANHLMIRQDKTDDFVRGVVAELVRDPRVRAAMAPQGDDNVLNADRERRTVLEQRLANFEDDYADGEITGTQLRRSTERVTKELEEIDVRIAVALQRSMMSPVLGAIDPGQAFLDAPVDVQRAVLAQVLTIEVLPSARRGVAWSADRIRLIPVATDAAGPMTSPMRGEAAPSGAGTPAQGLDPDCEGVETHVQSYRVGRSPDHRITA
jgi:site-specific DNA recombinase